MVANSLLLALVTFAVAGDSCLAAVPAFRNGTGAPLFVDKASSLFAASGDVKTTEAVEVFGTALMDQSLVAENNRTGAQLVETLGSFRCRLLVLTLVKIYEIFARPCY